MVIKNNLYIVKVLATVKYKNASKNYQNGWVDRDRKILRDDYLH